jgi:hypothetical protein
MMLPAAATACRRAGLRLYKRQSKPRKQQHEQQTGNWAPHDERIPLHHIQVPCERRATYLQQNRPHATPMKTPQLGVILSGAASFAAESKDP